MAKRRRHTTAEVIESGGQNLPTNTRKRSGRRVPPDEAPPSGPKYYRGQKPWHELTPAEQAHVKEAAKNSVGFFNGPTEGL